ncbi:neurotrypsin-like isoform A [Micractinium conductrix]|uniref:Neurotrypsin-like isoform A n=1 Tax=Micractinium conductrix TaxID=554055 RepID=A0A2P6VL40_9CHLO|nr:neurotrypsin-like isoform A [Micractinium conductrix]|eukprot:PSC74799.1 neurotrypsin-like isoform A [Micractinium conductrix]
MRHAGVHALLAALAAAVVAPALAAAADSTDALPASITDVRVAGAAQQGVLEVQGADGRWFGGIQLCLPAPPGDASDSEELLKELEAAVSSVACRQLGFPGGRALSAYPAGGSGADAVAGPTLRALLLCGGNETSVDQCDLVESECSHAAADTGDPLAAGDEEVVRTVVAVACDGGPSPAEGRLEVRLLDGRWGSVCGGQGAAAAGGGGSAAALVAAHRRLAQVVCRGLGYGGGAPRVGAFYGDSLPPAIDDVACVSSEGELQRCSFRGGAGVVCSEGYRLGVACAGAETITDLRLVAGPSPREGRLEVQLLNGTWGTVSGQASTPDQVAAVVCRPFGVEDGEARTGSFYGDGSLPLLLWGLACQGGEEHLNECHLTKSLFQDEHWDDLGVSCQSVRAWVGGGLTMDEEGPQ